MPSTEVITPLPERQVPSTEVITPPPERQVPSTEVITPPPERQVPSTEVITPLPERQVPSTEVITPLPERQEPSIRAVTPLLQAEGASHYVGSTCSYFISFQFILFPFIPRCLSLRLIGGRSSKKAHSCPRVTYGNGGRDGRASAYD